MIFSPAERPATITRAMSILLVLSAMATSSLGFTVLPTTPSAAALAARGHHPARGVSACAGISAPRLAPQQPGWIRNYSALLGSHVSWFSSEGFIGTNCILMRHAAFLARGDADCSATIPKASSLWLPLGGSRAKPNASAPRLFAVFSTRLCELLCILLP